MKRITRLPPLPQRGPDTHKGDCGRVLVVGGSLGMSGAAALATRAALRSGAGLVTVGVPLCLAEVMAVKLTCAMTLPLPDTPAGTLAASAARLVLGFARGCDAVGLGPGLSRDKPVVRCVREIARKSPAPLVVDADGLNALVGWSPKALPDVPRVLTPHPGEAARLLGCDIATVQSGRVEAAAQIARRWSCVAVLKGHGSVICDGLRYRVNRTGNPGMATGGTGDVLTGVITALVAGGMTAFDAASLGAHLHGLAGDLAARKLGRVSLIASDLVESLPISFEQYVRKRRK